MLKWQNPIWQSVFDEFAHLAASSGLNSVHTIKWDQQSYVDNTTVSLDFFASRNQNPAQQNGIFPATNPFLMTAIGIYFPVRVQADELGGTAVPATVVSASNSPGLLDDIVNLVHGGVLRLDIEQRPFGPYPAPKLAAGCGFGGVNMAVGDIERQWGVPTLGGPDNLFQLDVPIIIRAQVAALFTLVWNAAINTAVGDVPIRIYLEGIEARSQVA